MEGRMLCHRRPRLIVTLRMVIRAYGCICHLGLCNYPSKDMPIRTPTLEELKNPANIHRSEHPEYCRMNESVAGEPHQAVPKDVFHIHMDGAHVVLEACRVGSRIRAVSVHVL